MKKRILSGLLILCMLISIIPMGTAFAADTANSGSCGSALTWSLSDDGVLTINGTGAMTSSPWRTSHKNNITSVVVEEGVTSLCNNAFWYCKQITSISLPDTLVSMGQNVFGYCDALSEIVIPASVTSISEYNSFGYSNGTNIIVAEDNPNYSSVDGVLFNKAKTMLLAYTKSAIQPEYTIPDGVKIIGNGAFMGSSELTSVTIPASVNSMDYNVFYYCGKLNINVDKNNKNYSSIDGVLFNKNKTTLIAYAKGITQPEYTIPDGVVSLESSSFTCDGLTKITIPASVTDIDAYAFNNCHTLNIEVSSANRNYSSVDGVLFNKSKTELIRYAKDEIQPVYTIPNGVTTIGDDAFDSCYNLTSVTIPDSVTVIGIYAFGNCEALTSITLPESITTISYDAFGGCTALTDITIPSNVTFLSNDAFQGCGSLNINVSEDNENYSSIDGVLFNKDKTTLLAYAKDALQPEYTIPDGVTTIGEYTFWDCDSLTSVTIPEGVTEIKYYAFCNCPNLTSVNIPSTMNYIESNPFTNCGSLNITVSEDNVCYSSVNGVLFDKDKTTLLAYAKDDIQPEYTIPDGVTTIDYDSFESCKNLTGVTIPEGVEAIESYAFNECTALASINIPSTVTDISTYAFWYCNSLNINVSEDNAIYSSIDGVLFNKDKTTLISYVKDKVQPVYTVPSGTKTIGENAFCHCDNLTSIVIADSVENIEYSAFTSCTALTSVTLPSGLSEIKSSVFYSCETLASINIPEGVTIIDSDAFAYCTALSEINIPASTTSIAGYAFRSCGNLNINVAEDNAAYSSVDGVLFNKDKTTLIRYTKDTLKPEYTIPDGVTVIDYDAFYNCKNLTSVTIPEGVTTINSYAFGFCEDLTNVNIPSSVSTISINVFYNCGNVNINVSEDNANYSSVDGVLFNKDKTTLISYVKDKAQPVYTVPDGVTAIGESSFRDSKVTSITLPDSVKTIGNNAFQYCDRLSSIVLPDGLNEIGSYAFYQCSALAYIDIPQSVTSIGYTAFGYCYSLTDVTIPEGVTTISSSTFTDCSNIKSITIPQSVTIIDYNAFSYCDALKDVYYPGSEDDWNAITIRDGNEPLTNAKNHYNYVDITPVTKTSVEKNGDTTTITVAPSNAEIGVTILVALYKNGEFAEVITSTYSGENVVVSTTKDYDKIKVMMWNNIDDMVPVSKAEKVKL